MNEKTPITILQELCVANGTLPLFNLIHDGSSLMKPVFKYQVNVFIKDMTVSSVGTGRSKKEAKHDSARKALEKLSQLNLCDDTSPNISDLEPVPRFVVSDAIRHLAELCEERKLPIPEYELIQDIGPPHARQFTMMCRIASLKQKATATTKKAAKQLSASNMLDLLRAIDDDEIDGKEVVSLSQSDVNKVLEQKQEKIILTNRFSEYDSPFQNYDNDKCVEARNILNNDLLSHEERVKRAFDALELKFEILELPTVDDRVLFLFSTLRLEPEIHISEFTLEDLYCKTNLYLSTFLE